LKTSENILNISSIYLEKLLRVLINLYIISILSRYLGPADFGNLIFSENIIIMLIGMASLGLDSVIIKLMLKHDEKVIINNTFTLKLILNGTFFLLTILFNYWLNNGSKTFILFNILSLNILFSSFDIIEIFYSSKVRLYKINKFKTISLIIGAALKLYMVKTGLSIIYFAMVIVFEYITNQLLIYIFYLKEYKSNLKIRFNKKLIVKILSLGLPLALGAISQLIYSRIDQIFIKNDLNDEILGNYLASLRICDFLLFSTFAINTTLFPRLISKINFHNQIKNMFLINYLVSFAIICLIILFHEQIILLIYGNDFNIASNLLLYMIFSVFLYSYNDVNSKILLALNLEKIFLLKTLISISLSILLNIIFIRIYGIYGVILSTYVTLIISEFILDLFIKKTRFLILYKLTLK